MKMLKVSDKLPTGRVNIPKEHLKKSGIKLNDNIKITSKKGVIEIRKES